MMYAGEKLIIYYLIIIDKNQHQKDLPSDNIFISNYLLAEIGLQDIVNINNAKTTQTPINIVFNTESMRKFYAIDSSSLFACYFFEEYKDLTIENDTSQPSNNLAPG